MLATILAQAADLAASPLTATGIQTFGAGILFWLFKKVSAMDSRLARIETKLGVPSDQIKTYEN